MVEFFLAQVRAGRFKPIHYRCCRCGNRAFAGSILPNHARQRSYLITNDSGRFVRLIRGIRAELLRQPSY